MRILDILVRLRAIPEPGGSLSVSNYAYKRNFSAITDNNSVNILRINGANSCEISGSNIVGRVDQKRSALNTGVDEGRDSFMSRLRVGLSKAETLTSMQKATAHTTVKKIQ